MTDHLPKPLRVLHADCCTIVNLCNEVERLTARDLWGLNGAEKKERAIEGIERRAQQLCDRLGMIPSVQRAYIDQIARLQAENKRLTAANAALAERRAA